MLQGLTPRDLANLTGEHVTSARRWLRTGRVPEPVRRLLLILFARELEPLSKAWAGWRISAGGVLVSPEQWDFTPGDVRSLPLLRVRLAELRNTYEGERLSGPLPIPSGAQFDWEAESWRLPVEPHALTAPHTPEFWPRVMERTRGNAHGYTRFGRRI